MKKSSIYTFLFLFMLIGNYASQAQCYEYRHSTNWHDAWTSCEESINPNPDRQSSHWIMYDMKSIFRFYRTWYWNYNNINALDEGIRNYAIDYSADGETWYAAGNFTFEQATGLSTYQGDAGPDLSGVEAQYLLITALSNYGGTCYGLSEMRFEAEELQVSVEDQDQVENSCLFVNVFPNPTKSDARVYYESDCKGSISYRLINLPGQIVLSGNIDITNVNTGFIDLKRSDLQSGKYILELRSEEGVMRKTILFL